jgi:hypothetical protein
MKMKLWTSLALCSVFVIGCKEVNTTNAPGSSPQGASSGDAKIAPAQVGAISDVPLDQIPQLTVSIEIGKCLGTGRWYDSGNPAKFIAGAVSVTPTRQPKGDLEQPTPWVFDPTIEKAGSLMVSQDSQHWRLDKADYSIEVVAYEVESPDKKTALTISGVNFNTSNDVKYTVEGNWNAVTSKCDLAKKP